MTVLLERPVETQAPAVMRKPLQPTGRALGPHEPGNFGNFMCVRAHISADLIARSVPGSPTMCMLALGLAEVGFINPHIEEGNCSVTGYQDGSVTVVEHRSLDLNDEIIEAVRAFDRGDPVEPFDFFLTFYL